MKARVSVMPLAGTDTREFVAAASASRKLHAPWVSAPLTAADFRAKLKRLRPPVNYGFAVRRLDSAQLVGYIEITNVVRGVFLSGYLGYYAFTGGERHGFMKEAMGRIARHAFEELGLHRLEANIQPGNKASIALVRSCGFRKEGYSPRYLRIRGRWCDHERWAMLRKR